MRFIKRMFNKLIKTEVIENSDNSLTLDRNYTKAIKNPYFRRVLRERSAEEDENNPYYSGILNTYAEHSVGAAPQIITSFPSPEVCDAVEDAWFNWSIRFEIATAIRQIRRAAIKTGVGIGIPIKDPNPENPVGFKIKTVSGDRLTTPIDASLEDNIIDGIMYDENGEPQKIFLKDGTDYKEYDVNDIIVWWKKRHEESLPCVPECGPAFCIYPSIKRIIEAVVKAEEFRSCIPMAVELDKDVYRPKDAATPAGKFKYEPGVVPTLPPGTRLIGVNTSAIAENRMDLINGLVAAAARCLQMPKNLAIADSSNSNMATAAIDLQPWSATIRVDRIDFYPVLSKVIDWWYNRAILVTGYLPVQARSGFSYELSYDMTFEHPDPSKRAKARAIDLQSGATTLSTVYTDQGKNPRKQLDREARTLGISREELNKLIIAQRVSASLQDMGLFAADEQ